jgi:hypothetical protein
MGDVVQGRFPFAWSFTKRQLEQLSEQAFADARPERPVFPTPGQPDPEWWKNVYEPWRKALRAWDAEQRRRVSIVAPHPNWENRKKRCAVQVEIECDSKRGQVTGYKGPHRARWEHVHLTCSETPVAYDGTDRRRVGYLYGACARHIAQAMADDPDRVWIWGNGVVIDDTFNLEDELTMLALGDLRAGAR